MRKPTASLHEDLTRRHEVRQASERSFGVVFAVAFAVIAAFPLLDGGGVRVWALVVAAVFLVVSLARPSLLRPLNWAWLKLGAGLHRVVSPLILGIMFYLVITPTALVMRLFGKGTLNLRFQPGAETYWVERDPPGPAPETMRDQF